ncbi:MAG: toll/interleukin-1 receptor domain-containing protein [Actinomycetota bacterium]|nr:toll/interleukin-1 receptor domain-containing protein [Actinomycetota bacterium]
MSYTQIDHAWAEWIAWLLEEDGYRVLVQAWDLVAGSNWISRIDQGVQRAARTVAVLSPDYLSSVYGNAEWQAAWASDPQGQQRTLLTVRIRGDWPAGLLTAVVGIDLVGLSEADARRRLRERSRPRCGAGPNPACPHRFRGARCRWSRGFRVRCQRCSRRQAVIRISPAGTPNWTPCGQGWTQGR